jgi:repressor LexA
VEARTVYSRDTALTRRQREVIHAIVNYQIEHDGRSPSLRELQEELDLSSTSSVFHHICTLEKAGYITCEPFRARSIRLVD